MAALKLIAASAGAARKGPRARAAEGDLEDDEARWRRRKRFFERFFRERLGAREGEFKVGSSCVLLGCGLTWASQPLNPTLLFPLYTHTLLFLPHLNPPLLFPPPPLLSLLPASSST